MAKIITADKAAELISDGITLGVSGFGTWSTPDSILKAMTRRFRKCNSPKNLTIVSGVAPGDFADDGCGLSNIKDDGIIDTLYASHLVMSPPIGRAINENKIAAFSIPLGIYGRLMEAIASKSPGVISKVGLNTYADPRNTGCIINEKASKKERKIVDLVEVDGKEYLLYKSFPIDMCIISASYVDEYGNVSVQDEPVMGELYELAAAVHNNGGTVIVEAKEVVKGGSLKAKDIIIHKSMVDYIVRIDRSKLYNFNCREKYWPELTGDVSMPLDGLKPLKLDPKKVISRRAVLELKKDAVLNLGIGIPSNISSVVAEENLSDDITLSVETGVYGGVPMGGNMFGATTNPEALLRATDVFAFYDGGGLDMTVLGAAEIDYNGNVNVSKFAGKCVGPGGFVDISQNTHKVCFAFTFTAGQQDIRIENGRVRIVKDGSKIKFKKSVEQITFSGKYALQEEQEVLFITERAVFKLINGKLTLTEIAPGIDLQKDILDKMDYSPDISKKLKEMDLRLFLDSPMGLVL